MDFQSSGLALVTNDRAAVQDAIDKRLQVSKRLQTEVLALRSQLNRLTAVCRLPDEVLAEIFLQYVKEFRTKYENAAWDDYDQQPNSWLTITQICRKWREVAVHHPRLWDWIVPLRPESTAAFIARSGQRPLIIPQRRLPPSQMQIVAGLVTPWTQNVSDVHDSWKLIYQQLHRVERADLHANYPSPEFPPEDAPMLRSLTIRNAKSIEIPALNYLKTLSMPLLTAFHCWSDPAKLQPMLRGNLYSLTLSGEFMQTRNKDTFLDILQGIPTLRRLRVDRVDRLFPLIGQALPEPTRRVALPNLHLIHVTEHSDGRMAASMLQHLTLPANINVTVFGYRGRARANAMSALFDVVGGLGAEESRLVMGVHTPNAKAVEVSFWPAPENLATYRRHEDWGAPRLRYRVHVGERYRSRSEGLQSFGESLGDRAFHIAAVYVDCPLLGDEWNDAFELTTNVQQVYVCDEGSKYLPDGLRPVALFPNLQVLILDQITWCIHKDPAVACNHPCKVAKTLASAMAERGGVRQLVIRRGKQIISVEVDHIATWGNVDALDWDGVASE